MAPDAGGPEVQRVPEDHQQRRTYPVQWAVPEMLGLGVCRPGAGALAIVRVTPATVVPSETPALRAAMLVGDKSE